MIPKIIHYCWFSGEKYPPQIKACIKSWQKHLNDYKFILWDRNRFDFDTVPFVRKCINMRKWAFAADYIRLYAVYTMGGIYLDSDVLVHNSFDFMLDNNAFWGIDANEKQKYAFPEAAIFGAVQGFHPIREMMSYYEHIPLEKITYEAFARLTNVYTEENRSIYNKDGVLHLVTAPVVMESVLRKYGYKQVINNQKLQNDIHIYSEPLIQNNNKVDTPETIAHHINASSWFYTDRGPIFKFCHNHPFWMPMYKKIETINKTVKQSKVKK